MTRTNTATHHGSAPNRDRVQPANLWEWVEFDFVFRAYPTPAPARSSSEATKSPLPLRTGPPLLPKPSPPKVSAPRLTANTQRAAWRTGDRADRAQLADITDITGKATSRRTDSCREEKNVTGFLLLWPWRSNEQLIPAFTSPTARRGRPESHSLRGAPYSLQRFTVILGAVLLLDFAVFVSTDKNTLQEPKTTSGYGFHNKSPTHALHSSSATSYWCEFYFGLLKDERG